MLNVLKEKRLGIDQKGHPGSAGDFAERGCLRRGVCVDDDAVGHPRTAAYPVEAEEPVKKWRVLAGRSYQDLCHG
ncbi:hypothetical protein [Rhodococcoides fascians]|uniref:hypothetical protein n=1 Tax=Rhodococcoides fascians TaxID=1828 RepID=UPI0012D3402A|nr:hypothetical protein [Rhodococcus fascians]